MPAPKRRAVTWQHVEEYVASVVAYVHEKNIPVTGVFGPPRGGLIFAVMLSHKLHVPLLMHPYGNCIIVDDIADTGKSLIHYRPDGEVLADCYFITTMFYCPKSIVKPDFYWKEKTDDAWLIYPWEDAETEGI